MSNSSIMRRIKVVDYLVLGDKFSSLLHYSPRPSVFICDDLEYIYTQKSRSSSYIPGRMVVDLYPLTKIKTMVNFRPTYRSFLSSYGHLLEEEAISSSLQFNLPSSFSFYIYILKQIQLVLTFQKEIFSSYNNRQTRNRRSCPFHLRNKNIPSIQWYCLDCEKAYCDYCFFTTHFNFTSHRAVLYSWFYRTYLQKFLLITKEKVNQEFQLDLKEKREQEIRIQKWKRKYDHQKHISSLYNYQLTRVHEKLFEEQIERIRIKQYLSLENNRLRDKLRTEQAINLKNSTQQKELTQLIIEQKEEIKNLLSEIHTSKKLKVEGKEKEKEEQEQEQKIKRVIWEWLDNNYVPYDFKSQKILEEAYLTYLTSTKGEEGKDQKEIINLTINKVDYQINFIYKTQTNIRTKMQRSIRRNVEQIIIPSPSSYTSNLLLTFPSLKERKFSLKEVLGEEKEKGEEEKNKEIQKKIKALFYSSADQYDKLNREKFELVFIKEIRNPKLLQRYEFHKRQMGHFTNEQLLFHGPRTSNMEDILEEGLDTRVSNSDSYLGQGIYCTASMPYVHHNTYAQVKRKDEKYTYYQVLVISVLLGCVYEASQTCHNFRRAPLLVSSSESSKKRCDSVSLVVSPKSTKIYSVYDNCQVYPLYLIEYKMKNP